MPYSQSFKVCKKVDYGISGYRRFGASPPLAFNFRGLIYMELSENYKSFSGNFLRYFLVFSKIMFVNIKKSALKSGGLIFLPYICNVLLRNF